MNPKRILIVDDSPVVLKALSNSMRTAGYEVVTAEDGATAVGLVRREKPDLLLLDVNFPDEVNGESVQWDGFRIMGWLGRLEQSARVPIIIITGEKTVQYKARALAAGAVAYFEKPIDNRQLLATISQILGQNSGKDKAAQNPPNPGALADAPVDN